MQRPILVSTNGITVSEGGKTTLEPHGDPELYLGRSPFPGSISQPLGLKISTSAQYRIFLSSDYIPRVQNVLDVIGCAQHIVYSGHRQFQPWNVVISTRAE